jgi:hypothetical protein
MEMVGAVNPMDETTEFDEGKSSHLQMEKIFSGGFLYEVGLIGWIVIIVIVLALFGNSNSGSGDYDPDGGYEPDVCYDARAPYYC